jgi:uncharacterized protein (TIGR00730 family)
MNSTNWANVISVFGSHAPLPGSEDYQQAMDVGRLLAETGFTVATGGYGGTMQAVSQGAAEAEGEVIGVTCTRIEMFRSARLNSWATKEIRYETLQERALHLVKNNRGVIVLPGGIGTLSEFALAWSLLQVDEISPRPLVLLGKMWKETLRTFIRDDYIHVENYEMLSLVDTAEAAVMSILDNHIASNLVELKSDAD